MKRSMFFLLVLLLGAVIFTTGCAGSAGEEPVAKAAPPEEEKIIPVEVAVAQKGQMALVLEYAGTIEAKDNIDLLPGASGRIESVLVAEGDDVQAGDPIAIIEDDTYLAQIKQAEIAVTTAKLNLAKMELGSRPEEIAAAQAAVELARAAVNDVAQVNDNERTRAAAELARAQAALKSPRRPSTTRLAGPAMSARRPRPLPWNRRLLPTKMRWLITISTPRPATRN
ncbi:MAG: biotin/lipoyl-binding protein [Anaerolineales bacterium]|nr:biotin/lipoyl-binding protein [Anaerolineales bacterium]